MMKTTPWKHQYTEYTEGSEHYRIRATYGIGYDFGRRNNQAAYFSITGETEQKHGTRWVEDSCGCIHDQIVKHFPELASLVKWHLFAIGEGPMHYEANAIYWWEHAEAIRTFSNSYEWEKYGSPRAAALTHFKSTIVYGGISRDAREPMPREGTPPTKVREWLRARKADLLDTFMHEMLEADVLEGAEGEG